MSEYFKGKKILVIGGTGTIGRKIIDILLNCEPEVIRVFSRDEYKQFEMQSEIEDNSKLRYLIGDIRDFDRVVRASKGVDIIIHLAAMKHVPACEYNPFEAVQTNVIGTQNIIQAAVENKVSKVIFTSSDKAISPTNAMGATKLLAERLISSANYYQGTNRPVFAAVRFGNVMNSRGSVIPLFEKQILNKKEITITDGEMSRFMMTIDQAAHLTLEALESSKGGEIFVLKMPVVKLNDFAEVIIEKTCKAHNINSSEVNIKKIGLRVGEKMYEELMTEEESKAAFELENMFLIASPFYNWDYYKIYHNIKKAEIKTYSSTDDMPVSKNEIYKMISII